LNTKLRLALKCNDSAAALAQVLNPDNRSVPSDQVFSMKRERENVLFSIQSSRPASAFTSLDSVLSDAALFQEVWLLSRRTRGRDRKKD